MIGARKPWSKNLKIRALWTSDRAGDLESSTPMDLTKVSRKTFPSRRISGEKKEAPTIAGCSSLLALAVAVVLEEARSDICRIKGMCPFVDTTLIMCLARGRTSRWEEDHTLRSLAGKRLGLGRKKKKKKKNWE